MFDFSAPYGIEFDNNGNKQIYIAKASAPYWWIEEIEDEELAYRVKCLSSDEIEMLTLLAFDGYTQAEAAKKMGIPYRTFKFKLRNIKNFLRKF